MWLEACVKIKWICTEESSQEGGAQGLMKYIKIKQTIETPTGRTLVMYIYLSTDPYITFENARDRASTERKVSQVGNKHGHVDKRRKQFHYESTNTDSRHNKYNWC
jgi:hypothetical protein